MSSYVWYSFGSDTTGPRLAEALGFQSGKKKPNFEDYDVVIGFGCKSKELVGQIPGVAQGNVRILNHPDEVEQNRDKVATLQRLAAEGISVPGMVIRNEEEMESFFEAVRQGLDEGVLAFPIIGQSHNHSGDVFFCYTLEDVQVACTSNGIDYFRSFCPGTEFRIHVLRDMAIFGQIKALSDDPAKQTRESLKSRLIKRIKKKELGLEISGAGEWVLDQLVPELLRGPSQLLRSIDRGWTLKDINLNQIPEDVIAEAINAIEVAGLDLGAVSLVFDERVARVTNITTAPSIPDSAMPAYVGAIQEFINTGPKSRKKIKATKIEAPSPELIARFTHKLREVDANTLEALLKALE